MIGDNIKFIGTVNVDESTYHFSDKVLDRANIISLQILNYSKEWYQDDYSMLSEAQWTFEDYNKIIENPIVDLKLREFLWEMHIEFQKAYTKLGIGPRIVKNIELYLSNLPKMGDFQFVKNVGLDYQVVQRILTKVRGPENQLNKLLSIDYENSLDKIFDKYSELSDFSICRKSVEQKRKEIESYGYCI